MEDPRSEITSVISRLTQGSPSVQQQTIDTYFTPNAEFTHPFVRTGSWEGSRYLIHAVYRWYKIMSPRIELDVHSIAYDEQNMLLYVGLSQVFAIWLIPFHRAHVHLTTVLTLTRPPNSNKYYIKSQNDLYQTNQFASFVLPRGIGYYLVWLWQVWATFFCVVGAVLLAPVTWLEESWADAGHQLERRQAGDLVNGAAQRVKRLGLEVQEDGQEQFGRMQVIK